MKLATLLAAAPAGSAAGSTLYMIGWILILGLVFYFMIYRPQKKQQKKQDELMASIAIGDSILTTAGFYGVVIDVMEEEKLMENANSVGNFLMKELRGIEGIKDVRGRGLMIGIEFEEPIKEIRRRLLFEEHVFTGVSGTNVIRLLPPLTLTIEQAAEFIDRFKRVI